MRIAPLFLTLLRRYLGLKHLLTCLLDSFTVDEVLSGSISGLRLLPLLSVIIEISLSCPSCFTSTEQRYYITNTMRARHCLSVSYVCNLKCTYSIHVCISHTGNIFIICVLLKWRVTVIICDLLLEKGPFMVVWNTSIFIMTMSNLLSTDVVVSILVSVYRHQQRVDTPTVH